MSRLAAALLAAQRSIGGAEKNSRNEFAGYDYTSCEAMLALCRRALHDAGLFARRSGWSMEGTVLVMVHELVHAESGESQTSEIQWPIVEGKGRPLDKAVASALSSAWTYWLRDLLLVPRGLGDDMDARDDRGHAPAAQAPARQEQVPPSLANAFMLELADAQSRAAVYAVGQRIREAELGEDEKNALREAFTARLRALTEDSRG